MQVRKLHRTMSSFLDEILFQWDAITYTRNRDLPLIRVFIGGKSSNQGRLFSAILSRVPDIDKVEIEYVTTEFVRESAFLEHEIIEYLLEADAHFIIGHLHQGSVDTLSWDLARLTAQMKRLKYHQGIPLSIILCTFPCFPYLLSCRIPYWDLYAVSSDYTRQV